MTRDAEQPETESRQVEAFEPLPGELLIAARRSRGISPERVAESLNLDVSVIYALEDNRFEDLGAPVFARGHLRKYARLLELDAKDVLSAYDAIATEQSGTALTIPAGVAEAGPPASRSWIRPLILAMAALAILVLLWRIVSNGDGTPEGESAGSVPGEPTTAESAPDADAGPRLPLPRPAQAPVEEASVADGSSEISERPVEPRDASEPPEKEPTREAPMPAVARDTALGSASRVRPEPVAPVAQLGRSRVVFSFERDSWLEVRDADGRRLAYEMGRGGRSRSVTGRPPFEVSVGLVQGVAITVDGEPFEIPASAVRGNTARFSIPGSTD